MSLRPVLIAASFVLIVVACDVPPGPPTDGGAGDAGRCTDDSVCNDGLYCNGVERCAPLDPSADARGCLRQASPCAAGSSCDEAHDRCSPCEVTSDADGDGVDAVACGGADCDDADPHRFPGNTEVCDVDSRDEDCDPHTFGVRDADGDGAPDARCCNTDATASYCGDDCDDARATVHPSSAEVCNGRDDDCDAAVDEGVTRSFHPDLDRDGYGDTSGTPVAACDPPIDHVEDALDCDDTDQHVNPATSEICDGVDNNCNGVVDEAGTVVIYQDADHDGFGDPATATTSTSCVLPTGRVAIGTDCNDADATQHPGVTETCNSRDDDCSLPGGARGGADVSEDRDGDGHAPLLAGCTGGYPVDDCDDADAITYGGASEICDGRDNDCAGGVDDANAASSCASSATCDAGACRAGRSVAAGGFVSCALDGRGGVDCWGPSALYRGDGGTPGTYLTRVAGLNNVVHVVVARGATTCEASTSCFSGHACALLADGRVACWGAGADGQLGDGATSDRGTPVFVVGLTDAVDVAAGTYHTCARRRTGAVVCWGENVSGQLGDGTTTMRLAPVVVSGVSEAVELSVGSFTSCARVRDGRVQCWGNNGSGQLGGGSDDPVTGAVSFVDGARTIVRDAIAVATGDFTCVVRASGQVLCVGLGYAGQLGDGGTSSRVLAVSVAGLVADAARIETGPNCGCALGRAGGVTCWGTTQAQFGDGVFGARSAPGSVTELAGYRELSLGTIGCGRDPVGALRCWGTSTQGTSYENPATSHWPLGHLGDGGALARPIAVLDASVRAGIGYRCAANAAGELYCWGRTRGSGTRTGSTVPTLVPGMTDVRSIAAGACLCVARGDGRVLCRDDISPGSSCTTGDGTMTGSSSTTPVIASGLSDAVSVAASDIQVCALESSGNVACWGTEWGATTSTEHLVPTLVGGLTGVSSLHAGGFSEVCAIASGDLRCWGHLSQVGLTSSATPTLIGGIHDARSVALEAFAGSQTEGLTCVVHTNGTLDCAGIMRDSAFSPDVWTAPGLGTPLFGITDAVDVVIGANLHACVLHASGSVGCWGSNQQSQLGDGTLVDATTPVTVVGVTDAVELVASYRRTCARTISRGVVCWGSDDTGALGRGGARPVAGFPVP